MASSWDTALKTKLTSIIDPGTAQYYGYSMDVDGYYAVISALVESKVYVYEKNNGAWDVETILVAPDETGNSFGCDVAISGDTIIVGARQYENESEGDFSHTNTGAIYLYKRNDEGVRFGQLMIDLNY